MCQHNKPGICCQSQVHGLDILNSLDSERTYLNDRHTSPSPRLLASHSLLASRWSLPAMLKASLRLTTTTTTTKGTGAGTTTGRLCVEQIRLEQLRTSRDSSMTMPSGFGVPALCTLLVEPSAWHIRVGQNQVQSIRRGSVRACSCPF